MSPALNKAEHRGPIFNIEGLYSHLYGEGGHGLSVSEHHSVRGGEEDCGVRRSNGPCQCDRPLSAKPPDHTHLDLHPLVSDDDALRVTKSNHPTWVITGLNGNSGLPGVNDSTPSLSANQTYRECFKHLRQTIIDGSDLKALS